MLKRRYLTFLVAVPVALALGLLYYFFDPAQQVLMPKCPLHWLTGIECPGCGSQRAVHSLLHGDFGAAFEANALLVCLLPVILFLGVTEIFRSRWPRLYMSVHRPAVLVALASVILLWGVLRNLTVFL